MRLVPASHLHTEVAGELIAAQDARWRKQDAAEAAKSSPSKSAAKAAKPPKSPVPRKGPKKPGHPSGSVQPAAVSEPTVTLQPGSVILTPEEGQALDHLLDHPAVKRLIEAEDL
jgi:hypothetical protein